MPQLSPLNWVFLFLLFWGVIFLVFSMMWWESKVSYLVSKLSPKAVKHFFKENKWIW
uniref:ATP synthase F0 subunit 8 n=1 Tax=Tylomelania sarasinorum TaxID=232253 RepID=A0A2Z1Q3H3_9CAEN|nr:ATP synthase F0 subunit 8 [Tylomelania sarasinorum]AND97137.1 ATP synthase F0 subunit 8 [Tylomelania sarasinorum]